MKKKAKKEIRKAQENAFQALSECFGEPEKP